MGINDDPSALLSQDPSSETRRSCAVPGGIYILVTLVVFAIVVAFSTSTY